MDISLYQPVDMGTSTSVHVKRMGITIIQDWNIAYYPQVSYLLRIISFVGYKVFHRHGWYGAYWQSTGILFFQALVNTEKNTFLLVLLQSKCKRSTTLLRVASKTNHVSHVQY